MKKIKKFTAIAATVVVMVIASPLTLADLSDGMYFSGFIGASKALNNSYHDGPQENGYALNNDYGFTGGVAIGYRFDCFRAEFSVAYTKNDDDRIDIVDAGTASDTAFKDTGDQTATTFMLNAYYDFVTESGFVPFIGAGIGAAHLRHDYGAVTITGGDVITMRANDTVFAYQIILGVGCDITDNLRATLDYRFIGTTTGDFRIRNRTTGPTSTRVKGDYLNNQVNIGLTYFI